MGCSYSRCFRSCKTRNVSYKVALKVPHGLQYIDIDDQGKHAFKENVHDWLNAIYQNKKYTHYINYNDEHTDKVASHGGHCKGCIAWNDHEISWLIHSIPKFMIHFEQNAYVESKTHIHHSEQIYGQSLAVLSDIPISHLPSILGQIANMRPFVDQATSNTSLPEVEDKTPHLTTVRLSEYPLIEHIAKSPNHHIDLFSESIQVTYGGTWKCETWIRGHRCDPGNTHVIDNKTITYQSETYPSSRDHSKYACNDKDRFYIGDLNRMTSQFHRGGGGLIIQDEKIAKFMQNIMLDHI